MAREDISYLVKTAGYCGLVCGLCENGCPCKLSPKNGDVGCYQRSCCEEKSIAGCWECGEFPCGKGYFSEHCKDWQGLCLASVQTIKRDGLEGFVRLTLRKLGPRVDYGRFIGKSCDAIIEGLRDEQQE